jgi:hypothetical protein
MTSGSMARSLLKQLPELLRSRRRKFFAPFQASIALLGGLFQSRYEFGTRAVFALCVIRGLDVDLPKRDDIGATDNANILTPCRGRQPAAQIFLRIGNRSNRSMSLPESIEGFNRCAELPGAQSKGSKSFRVCEFLVPAQSIFRSHPIETI